MLRYAFTGILNTGVDIALLNFFLWMLPNVSVVQIWGENLLAYLLASLHSFCWQTCFTFMREDGRPAEVTWARFLKFFAVSLGGGMVNTLLFAIALHFYPQAGGTGFDSVLVKGGIAGILMFGSFTFLYFFVYQLGRERWFQVYPKRPRVPYDMQLSVVLPAYNEEKNIGRTMDYLFWHLTFLVQDFEVIVVNDGSSDGTAEKVKQRIQTEERLRLITHAENKGYGAALVTGFQAARKDLLFFMDADGQFDIRELCRMLPLIGEHDAVFGYREKRVDPTIRLLNAWGWKRAVRFFLPMITIRDIDCAFKLFRTELLQGLSLETGSALINAELLYKWIRAGYTYTEVPVTHLPRKEGRATGAKLSVIVRALHDLLFYSQKWGREEQ